MSVGIRTFEELVAAMRARRRELCLSQLQVDEIAGLPSGYTGKIEAWLTNPNARNARALGRDSLPLLLGALKMSLSAVPAKPPHAGKNVKEKSMLSLDDEKNVLAERGRKGGRMRALNLPREKRRAIARVVGKAR